MLDYRDINGNIICISERHKFHINEKQVGWRFKYTYPAIKNVETCYLIPKNTGLSIKEIEKLCYKQIG